MSLNSADVQQLQQLPGVDRSAAASIVAHREANGPFADPSDLACVEGFAHQRVADLIGRVMR